MIRALVRRTATGIILLFAVIVLNFLMLYAAPGDAVDVYVADGGAAPEMVEKIRAQFGLDRSWPVQLASYTRNVLTGDLGYSFHYRQPVTDVILRHLPVTILLGVSALFIATLMGTLLGVAAALRPRSATNHIVTVISLLGYATPTFWLGMIMLMLFAYWIPILPAFGMRSAPPPREPLAAALDIAWHMILPSITLAVLFMASFSRLSRASMLETMGADYIRTARAKGLGPRSVVFKHALRNASMPLVTSVGLQLGNLVSGAVLVEVVFSLPGIGPLLLESVMRRDYPVMLGILLMSAFMVIVANILTDLAYRLLDPRVSRPSND